MERRDVLKTMGLIGGSSLLPVLLSEFLASCSGRDMRDYAPVFFSKKEFMLVHTLVDILLPATSTRSASEVNVPVFLDMVFQQCIEPEEQKAIHEGLSGLGNEWEQATDKIKLVKELDEKAFGKKEANGWFRTFKKYSLIGYFTSQEGVTKASDYVKFPEAYKGDIPATAETLNYGKTTLHF